nr:hypothetical protein [Pirellulales bacterium]
MGAAYYIVLDREIAGVDPFVNGKAVGDIVNCCGLKFSGGDLFLFDSVDEGGSLNDVGEDVGAVEGSP